jgi:hypothetical protein
MAGVRQHLQRVIMEHELSPILMKLVGTDRRSIGKANEVVTEVIANPSLFEIVFDGISSNDPVLRMRCADVVEKITVNHPEYLIPYKQRLINEISRINQQEVRWHVAQLFSRIELTNNECNEVLNILLTYLKDKSKIVKTFSMQALADIAEQDKGLKPSIIEKLEVLTREGSPAMQSRGRKLLSKLKGK